MPSQERPAGSIASSTMTSDWFFTSMDPIFTVSCTSNPVIWPLP